ncbi:Uncharacterised protein [Mycobacteroides abscessus subsp. bolletii]|nr:Uncharacterised protein [Mycobacteroides abscessus subsp. bolletii]
MHKYSEVYAWRIAPLGAYSQVREGMGANIALTSTYATRPGHPDWASKGMTLRDKVWSK